MFPERIFIIGYMCSGKSSISRKLASRLGYNSFDTDDLFEEKYHVSVNDFFEKYGEDYFRKFEAEILRKTGDLRKVVISTGGGTPCYYDNMKWMKDNGMTVFIKVSPTTAYNRLVTAKRKRPLKKVFPFSCYNALWLKAAVLRTGRVNSQGRELQY